MYVKSLSPLLQEDFFRGKQTHEKKIIFQNIQTAVFRVQSGFLTKAKKKRSKGSLLEQNLLEKKFRT